MVRLTHDLNVDATQMCGDMALSLPSLSQPSPLSLLLKPSSPMPHAMGPTTSAASSRRPPAPSRHQLLPPHHFAGPIVADLPDNSYLPGVINGLKE
uniref:Uncharacterized protein n=1 Tax=Oryza punctata TaxID=4537 RepID=A0A0E0M060_ORYPU